MHRGAIHAPGELHVARQKLIFGFVPALGLLLREPRAMPDHLLDQVVRHVQTLRGPVAALAGSSAMRDSRTLRVQISSVSMCSTPPAPSASTDACDQQLDHADDIDQRAGQREIFHRVGFEHAAEQLSDTLVPGFLGLELAARRTAGVA